MDFGWVDFYKSESFWFFHKAIQVQFCKTISSKKKSKFLLQYSLNFYKVYISSCSYLSNINHQRYKCCNFQVKSNLIAVFQRRCICIYRIIPGYRCFWSVTAWQHYINVYTTHIWLIRQPDAGFTGDGYWFSVRGEVDEQVEMKKDVMGWFKKNRGWAGACCWIGTPGIGSCGSDNLHRYLEGEALNALSICTLKSLLVTLILFCPLSVLA